MRVLAVDLTNSWANASESHGVSKARAGTDGEREITEPKHGQADHHAHPGRRAVVPGGEALGVLQLELGARIDEEALTRPAIAEAHDRAASRARPLGLRPAQAQHALVVGLLGLRVGGASHEQDGGRGDAHEGDRLRLRRAQALHSSPPAGRPAPPSVRATVILAQNRWGPIRSGAGLGLDWLGMATSADDLLARARALSLGERARMVRDLIDSLDEELADTDADARWGKELARRARDVLAERHVVVETGKMVEELRDELSSMRRGRAPAAQSAKRGPAPGR